MTPNKADAPNPAMTMLSKGRRYLRGVGDLRRYANMRRIPLAMLLVLSAILLLGCPARWQVVFINGTNQELSVQLSGALDGKRRSFTLSQGHSRSEPLQEVQSLAVFTPSGALLFQRDGFGASELAPPLGAEYPHIYVLLMTTNAYVIPADYRNTWGEHIDEITRPK